MPPQKADICGARTYYAHPSKALPGQPVAGGKAGGSGANGLKLFEGCVEGIGRIAQGLRTLAQLQWCVAVHTSC